MEIVAEINTIYIREIYNSYMYVLSNILKRKKKKKERTCKEKSMIFKKKKKKRENSRS